MILRADKTSYYDIQEAMKALKEKQEGDKPHERQDNRAVIRDGNANPPEIDARDTT